MTDGRNEAGVKTLRLAVAMVSPIVAYLCVFPGTPLSVFGPQFLEASLILSILVLSVIPSAMFEAILSLVYAEGRYSNVLLLGVSLNAPRVALYLVLIPTMQGVGAAAAYLGGSIFGLMVAVILIRSKMRSFLSGRVLLGVLLPFSVCIISLMVGIPWLISGCILLLLVLFTFTRFRVVERSELEIVLRALTGKDTARGLPRYLSRFLDFAYGVR
jgi:O-antigen/teichoic acid export membrane protein